MQRGWACKFCLVWMTHVSIRPILSSLPFVTPTTITSSRGASFQEHSSIRAS